MMRKMKTPGLFIEMRNPKALSRWVLLTEAS